MSQETNKPPGGRLITLDPFCHPRSSFLSSPEQTCFVDIDLPSLLISVLPVPPSVRTQTALLTIMKCHKSWLLTEVSVHSPHKSEAMSAYPWSSMSSSHTLLSRSSRTNGSKESPTKGVVRTPRDINKTKMIDNYFIGGRICFKTATNIYV